MLGAVVIVAAVYGVSWIRQTLNTADDAFINGHVTLVAPRVRGQVARVVVDDNNNRVHKGDLLVELDKEPFQEAVAVKKAAFDSAQADLAATKATVRGIGLHRRVGTLDQFRDALTCASCVEGSGEMALIARASPPQYGAEFGPRIVEHRPV